MTTLKLITVDDSQIIADHVSFLLTKLPWIEWLGHAYNLEEARQLLQEKSPTAIILDIQLKEESGLDFLDEIKDKIIGVESNGLHSNGFTLARKVLSQYSLFDIPRYLKKSLGEELLSPTNIYVRPVMELKDSNIPIHGLAHITGGSFSKLKRLNKKMRFNLSNLPSPEGIFKQIQIDGNIDTKEMYSTFNMGVGFCLILPKRSVDKTIDTFNKYNLKAFEIGQIDSKGKGNVVGMVDDKKYIFS